MIGLGTWACTVNTMFYSGEVKVKIFDDNGNYGFKLDVPGVTIPDITVEKVTEDGDTVEAVTRTSLLPGKDIDISVTFDGDEFTGFVKIPFIGKIKLKDGRRAD